MFLSKKVIKGMKRESVFEPHDSVVSLHEFVFGFLVICYQLFWENEGHNKVKKGTCPKLAFAG
jgi:hypothetical protein